MSHRLRQTRARIAVLGAPKSGKSAFVVRYITKRFIGEYDHFKDMTYTHKTMLDKDELLLEFLDTAPGDEDIALEDKLRNADGYLILYSITDRDSFQAVRQIHSQITAALAASRDEDKIGLSPSIVIAGNKRDLLHLRQVTQNQRESLGNDLGCPTLEISVSENLDDVNEVMTLMIRLMLRGLRNSLPEKSGRTSTFDNMKRVFRRKIARSKSDSLYKIGHL